MFAGQFSQDDFGRFTDICKLFEANSRLDFMTVSRYIACLDLASAPALRNAILQSDGCCVTLFTAS